MNRRSSVRFVATAVCALALTGAAGEAGGANKWWNVASGDWSTAGNWTGGEPGAADSAYIGASGGISSGTALITQPNELCTILYLGETAGDTGTIMMSAGSLYVSVQEYVGISGRGAFDHIGGYHSVTTMNLGHSPGGSGTYALSGSATLVCPQLTLGVAGNGRMSQAGDSDYTGTYLYVGSGSNATGTYLLDGGTMAVAHQTVGSAGTGRFVQSGGANTATDLTVGYNAVASGEYVLSGGSLSPDVVDVGLGGTGLFTHTAGTHTVGDLDVGAAATGHGTYRLSGTGSLSAGGEVVGKMSDGGFEQSGGTNTIVPGAFLTIGKESGVRGTYTLSGGSLVTSYVTTTLGKEGRGTFVHSGGSHTGDRITLGDAGGAGGTYALSGTGTVTAATVELGLAGTGVIRQTGGKMDVTDHLYLGSGSGGEGRCELSDGELNTTHVSVGLSGTGSVIQTGGTHTAQVNVRLGLAAGGIGTYDLQGGLLDVHILDAGNTSTGNQFLHSGGTCDVDYLYVGTQPGAGGTYSLSGPAVLSAGQEYIGQQGAASLAQSGGTNNVSGCVWLGHMAAGDGTYTLSGGSLAAWELYVGNDGKGTFNQTGGTAAIGAGIYVGTQAASSGTCTLGGQLSGQTLYVGHFGTGHVEHSGGTVGVNLLSIANEAGSTGRYRLLGSGVVAAGNVTVGRKGDGELTIDGMMTVAGDLKIAAAAGSSGLLNVSSGSCSTGAVINNGAIDAYGGSLSAGALDNNAGASLTVRGLGWLQVDTVRNYAVAVQSGGVIRGKTGQQGTFHNYGTLTQDGGAFHDRLVNTGTYVYNAGTFDGLLENWGSFSFAKAFTAGGGLISYVPLATVNGRGITAEGVGLINYSALTLVPGGDLAGAGVTNAYGAALNGAGTIDTDLTNHGELAPTGLIVVTGTLTNDGQIAVQPLKGVRADAGLLNQAGGRIAGCGGVFADVTNDGGLVHANGASALSLTGLSGGNVGGGELRVADGATLQIGGAFASSGWITLGGAGAVLAGGTVTNTGAITGAGRVTGGVLNNGVIRPDGGDLTISGAGCTNGAPGQIEAPAGTRIAFTQGLAASSGGIYLGGGTFDASGRDMTSSGQITGHGAFRAGTLTNAGVVGVGTGDLEVLANLVNTGTVNVQAGATAVLYGDVSGPGDFTGSGTVMFLAGYSPGSSPGLVDFGGSVRFAGSASLAVEIGGGEPGGEYDQLSVAGTAGLGGALDVALIDGFLPEPRDAFEIIRCGRRDGEFDSAAGLDDLGGHRGLDFTLSYEPDGVELVASAHTGDATLDAVVDVLDLARLANHFGRTDAKWRHADFNGDGVVDVLDLAAIANNFGYDGRGAGPSGAGEPVPEPSSTILVIAGLCLLRRRRRRA